LTLPGLKLRPLGRPARSQSLYRLRYPGSIGKAKGSPKRQKSLEHKYMENVMIQVVLMKIKNKISLYSLYLKTLKIKYIYSSIEDSEDVLVLERNNAGLKKPSSFV
jgi:hypothetical protein